VGTKSLKSRRTQESFFFKVFIFFCLINVFFISCSTSFFNFSSQLFDSEPRHLVALAQAYATATAESLFYPHAKAFFRQLVGGKASAKPKALTAALHSLPKATSVAAVALAAAGSASSNGSSSGGAAAGEAAGEVAGEAATLGDALTWALAQWVPAVRAEQVWTNSTEARALSGLLASSDPFLSRARALPCLGSLGSLSLSLSPTLLLSL
jgi:hypothetical protein